MHAAGTGRKPGGRGIPEGEDERGQLRKEVVDSIKCSPACIRETKGRNMFTRLTNEVIAGELNGIKVDSIK